MPFGRYLYMKPNKFNILPSGEDYSEKKLFEKISKVARKAGMKAVYATLILYYALTDNNVAMKDKAIVIGALGYFICPVDFIPDLLGPMGYTDDFTTMILAVQSIWATITPSVTAKASARLEAWFGKVEDTDLELF